MSVYSTALQSHTFTDPRHADTAHRTRRLPTYKTMASPRVQTNENVPLSPTKQAPQIERDNTNRTALSNVSPNVKKSTTPAINALRGKTMTGSPLKRSFTAAVEGGAGFTYLKKRKLSDDEYLSDFNTSAERSQSQPGDSQFRPLLPAQDETVVPEIHEPTPTEPNTPTSDDSNIHSSQDRHSFSSLINFDPSSQTSNLVVRPVSHAEMLRLRLRVAMYKVRTNQIQTPFAELQIDRGAGIPPTQEAIEEAVATLKREALEVQARDQARSQTLEAVPKLLPGPLLRPTAYSSRLIYDTGYSSSPPAARLPDMLPGEDITPQNSRVASLSASPGKNSVYDPELTSSVVKGKVAEGLLGLRNAT